MIENIVNIKTVGVGGGGGNMVHHMLEEHLNEEIDLIIMNTDAQVLNSSKLKKKIQLGNSITKGLGAGMKPKVGETAALENAEEIKKELLDTDILFIATGLGGGTGTGAAPVIASIAKELGILTVSVATIPFKFEGRKRKKLAMEGLEELKKHSDSIIVIPNDKLMEITDKKMGIKESFKLVDEVLLKAVGGISHIILNHGKNDINLDFADVKTVMSFKGMALMGVGKFNGENAASEALKLAIDSPLLDKNNIEGSQGVLIQFTMNPNYPLLDINDAMELIEDSVDEETQIIFGTTTNENFSETEIEITIIATGFENKMESEKKSKVIKHPEVLENMERLLKYEEEKTVKVMPINNEKELKKNFNTNTSKKIKTNNEMNLDTPPWLRNRA